MYVFGVGVIGLALVTGWCGRATAGVAIRLRQRLLTAWGTILVFGAVLLLPWVHFQGLDYFDRQLGGLAREDSARKLITLVPWLERALDAVQLGSGADFVRLLPDMELIELADVARAGRSLSGFEVWRQVSRKSGALDTTLVLVLLAAVGGGIGAILALPSEFNVRWVPVGYGILALLALLMTLWHVPTMDSFGLRGDLPLDIIVFLSGARIGYGVWVTLLGLVMVVLGSILDLMGALQDGGDDWEDEWDEWNEWNDD
jgi:hypothetical protein